jgi:hypothetical protein
MFDCDYSCDEIHQTETRPSCANCGASQTLLFDYWTDDGLQLVLCEDCCEEERRIEKIADYLAGLPSCRVRQDIIDSAETTRSLVKALQAHDFGCEACGSTKKTGIEDRLFVTSAAICCGKAVA